MASVIEQLETELGLAPGQFSAAFGTEVRQIDAKIASVQSEFAKVQQEFGQRLNELAVLRAEAQARQDEALGKEAAK